MRGISTAPAAIATVVAAISAMVSVPVTASIMTAPVRATTVISAYYYGRRRVDHGRRRIYDRPRRVIHRRRRSGVDGISRHPNANTHRNVRLRGAHKAYANCGSSQNLDDLFHFYSPRRGPVHMTGYRNDMHSM
jgi:hypothetical protein